MIRAEIRGTPFPPLPTPEQVQQVVLNHAEATNDQIQAAWSGWKDGTGASQRAWSVGLRDGKVCILNSAPYTPYVHRAGTRTPEVAVVIEKIVNPANAALIARLGRQLVGEP